ncbi:MAG: peptide ABC transporter substrate-binding protein [Candidatus Geothermincolia bacterium]
MRARSFAIAFILVSLALPALAGCGKEAATPVAEGGGIKVALAREPDTLDPALLADESAMEVGRQLFRGLTEYGSSLETQPALAERWDVSGDSTVFTFHLASSRYSDGREVRAADFVYAWNRLASPETGSRIPHHLQAVEGYADVRSGAAGTLEGVSAVDDLTLEVTLSYPYSEFPAVCAHPALAPVSQEAFETATGHFGGQPAGTGRFRLASWERGARLVLEKNPEYAGTSPSHLDEVTFVIYPDAAAAYAAFTAGEVQEAPLPASERERARAERPEELYEYPLLGTYLLGFNMRAEPWGASRELRQAINYGIDRTAIAAALTDESWEPAGNILPPGMPGGGGAPYYTEDLERARDLLAQAGHSGGSGLPSLDLAYLDNASNRKVADEVRDQLARIDITVVPRTLATSEYATLILTRQLSFFRFSWQARYPNGDDVLYPLFYSGNADSDNLTQYASDEVDGLLEEARRHSDERSRLELLRQAEVRVLEDAPVIPLLYQRAGRMVATTLGGYARTPLDYTRYELLFLK